MELSRIYYWIWFCKNDSWKIYLNIRFCHNLAHVWHIFHIYENKNAPQINKNGPETWNAAPRVVPLTVLKFFMVDFFFFFILQIIWLLLTCWTSLCKWFTTYGSCKLLANLLNLMDSEKAFGLHVLALPTPCFPFFFPFCIFLFDLCSVPIDYQNLLSTHSDILRPLLSVSSLLWLLEVLQHSPNRSDP